MSGIDIVGVVDMWLGELTSVSASFYAAAVYLSVVREGKVFSERLGSSVILTFHACHRVLPFWPACHPGHLFCAQMSW
jgi:hypothetical protein